LVVAVLHLASLLFRNVLLFGTIRVIVPGAEALASHSQRVRVTLQPRKRIKDIDTAVFLARDKIFQ
jgi:hypothetical protein